MISGVVNGALFQLTTSQGGRHWSDYNLQLSWHFNSRPHKEVDQLSCALSFQVQYISTHDLTRRSTAKASGDLSNALTFQLTTSQGGRRNVYDLTFEDVDISTHDLTRRSTIDHQFLFLRQKYFNSRPHKEVDFFSVNASRPCIHISTHDLTRRSTFTFVIVSLSLYHFNSRPHKEVDPCCRFDISHRLHFNSRPHKEVDLSKS